MQVHQLHKAPQHMVPKTLALIILHNLCLLELSPDYIMTLHCETDNAQHPILFRQHI